MCTQGDSSENTRMVLEQLVALTVNQDHVIQGWLRFMLTIETSLVVAFSYLVTLFIKGDIRSLFLTSSVLLLPALGVVAATALTLIILRERKWQAWYVERIRALPAEVPPIYSPTPAGWVAVKSVNELPMGYISKVVCGLTVAIIVFWGVVFCFLFGALR